MSNAVKFKTEDRFPARVRRFVHRHSTRRRSLLLWMAIGIAAPILYLVWPLIGSPVPIIVSYETTRLSEEWLHNGQIDYYKYLAEELREAGVTSIADDPWMEYTRPT